MPRSGSPHHARALTTLVALVALSRLPLLGNSPGEPDTGLFLEGLWRWLSYGPHVAEIYDKNLSPAYYGLLAVVVRAGHIRPAYFPLTMNIFSCAAALLTAPFLYLVARRFLSPAASWMSTALFLMGPGLWWMGIEPHPQGLAIACFVIALYCFQRAWKMPLVETQGEATASLPRRPSLLWSAATVAALCMALLFRADHVLVFPAFFALLVLPLMRNPVRGVDTPLLTRVAPAGRLESWLRLPAADARSAGGISKLPRRVAVRLWLPPLAATTAMLALASALFLLLRSAILQESYAAIQAYSQQQTGGYLKYGVMQLARSGAYWLKQLLPAIVAPGVLAALLCALGWWLAARRWGNGWSRPWMLLFLGWGVVGYVFWFLVLGNNIRHVTVLALPLLWAGCDAWQRLVGSRRMVALGVLVLLLDPLLIPPSSNITTYASANVFASARDLHQRQAELRADLARMVASSARARGSLAGDAALNPHWVQVPACFLGSYTTPYMLAFLLLSQNVLDTPGGAPWNSHAVGMRVGPGWSDVFLGGAAGRLSWMRFYEMYSEGEYAALAPGCDTAVSVEYNIAGYHQRYLGQEWKNVPLRRLWYPQRMATVLPRPLGAMGITPAAGLPPAILKALRTTPLPPPTTPPDMQPRPPRS